MHSLSLLLSPLIIVVSFVGVFVLVFIRSRRHHNRIRRFCLIHRLRYLRRRRRRIHRLHVKCYFYLSNSVPIVSSAHPFFIAMADAGVFEIFTASQSRARQGPPAWPPNLHGGGRKR